MMTINSNEKDFIIKDGIWKGYKLWICMKKQKHHLSGIMNFLNMQKKIILKF